jgi:hypothetical protein
MNLSSSAKGKGRILYGSKMERRRKKKNISNKKKSTMGD